jgi:hypothetical protein
MGKIGGSLLPARWQHYYSSPLGGDGSAEALVSTNEGGLVIWHYDNVVHKVTGDIDENSRMLAVGMSVTKQWTFFLGTSSFSRYSFQTLFPHMFPTEHSSKVST